VGPQSVGGSQTEAPIQGNVKKEESKPFEGYADFSRDGTSFTHTAAAVDHVSMDGPCMAGRRGLHGLNNPPSGPAIYGFAGVATPEPQANPAHKESKIQIQTGTGSEPTVDNHPEEAFRPGACPRF
jgi:hypothetical protein